MIHARTLQLYTLPEPYWMGFLSIGGSDARACAALAADGIEAWYPTHEVHRRIARGKRKTYTVTRPIIGGYVFARFTGFPQWDLLHRKVGRVISMGGAPIAIPSAALARMGQLPASIAAAEAARIDAATIRPGDRAMIVEGIGAGWTVDIRSIDFGIARFILPFMGGVAGQAPVDRLLKGAAISANL